MCEQQIQNAYNKNPAALENISQLTSNARGTNKLTCMQLMGGTTQIKNFLLHKNYTPPVSTTGPWFTTTPSEKDQKETQVIASTSTETGRKAMVAEYGQYALNGVLITIGTLILLIIIKNMLRFFYDVFNSWRIIYLKVLLPRGQSKLDREQEKELAKDMKEKIWRMALVFHNFHKIGSLSMKESLMRKIFDKPKTTLIYHYEEWQLNFIIWTYPEYQQVLEGAVSAQFPNCSIERTSKPKFFKKRYTDVIPIEPKRDQLYNIKTFKQQPDDPMNNIIDAIGKISRYDTLSVIIPIKPLGDRFNKKSQKAVDRLYKNLSLRGTSNARWTYFIMPRKLIGFLIQGPSEKLLSNRKEEENVTMVRMVKAKEDYLNAMGEESALPFFNSWMLITTSSDEKENLEKNMDLVVSSLTIYGDEYGNELIEPQGKTDVFGWLLKPFRKIAVNNFITRFGFKKNVFGINELTSLFHFPDATYNRSPIISWMQYKVLPAPENLPIPKIPNGFVMGGVLAESYKWGKLDIILQEYSKHRATGEIMRNEEILDPIEKYSEKDLIGKEIIEKDGKKFVKMIAQKKGLGYKLFKDAILIGTNIFRNTLSPVYMKRDDRMRHHYCIGKSGTWKSVFLQTIARQDIRNGDGICLIDPHGDLAEDMLAYIPKERAKDVIYFDAGDEERPMGLNMFEINILDEADRVVNDATEIFIKMFWPEIFGPRLQEYFKYWSLTLLEDFEDRPTLLDVVRLFTDEWYREYKIKKVTNPTVKNRRDRTFNAMGDREKQEIIPYFSAKFVSFNTNRLIRNIIGQTKSAFKFDDVMDNKKILIINLSKGKIGELNANLLGMIIVSKIYTAAMGRARMAEADRKDFFLYVDEFQNFVSGTFADILSEARKYRLSLIMAHQYIAQLEPPKGLGDVGWGKNDVKAAVFGNVGTMQSFKVGAPDAEFLEKEYAPVLSQEDIVGIANYKAYIKLNIDNATTRAFSMNMIYTKDYQNKKIVPILKEYSAKKYGRKREFVDAEMEARLGITTDETKLPTQTEAERIAAAEAEKVAANQPKLEAPHIPITEKRLEETTTAAITPSTNQPITQQDPTIQTPPPATPAA